MKNKNEVMIKRGCDFCELLALIFIALKLSGVIKWNWFWVLSPYLIPIILYVIIVLIAYIILFFKK